jgi:AraC-like DNA-binding protein
LIGVELGMEKHTVDDKREVAPIVYFELSEDFMKYNDPMFRLVYVMEGSGIMKINGQTVIFSAPALFCFNELDEVELQQSINIRTQVVYFNPTVINGALQLDVIRKDNCILSITEYQDYFLLTPFIDREEFGTTYIEIGPLASKRISRLFEGMKEELTYRENKFWPCRSRSYLLETLFLIQNMITDSKNKVSLTLPEPTEDIRDIVLYLYTNYDKKVTIEELTDIFHINRTTLSEKFRKSTGISIIEYLVKYRIKMASIMLRETMLPISEILNRVGFNDNVHFSRMFKKHTGYTPSGYREKYIC